MIPNVNIAGFDVDCFENIDSAVASIITDHLSDGSIAVAINPEKILASRSNLNVRHAIDVANIRYLDGAGAVWIASKKSGLKINRIPGCELWQELMYAAAEMRIPVFILGAKKEVLLKTVEKLKADGVNVVGAQDGYFSDEDELIDNIKSSGAKILTVALGSPMQELFMEKVKKAGLNCFMMGVGGTYNVFVGDVKRAPATWCKLNLEWLYRLLCEPSRIPRQFKLIKYVILALSNKL